MPELICKKENCEWNICKLCQHPRIKNDFENVTNLVTQLEIHSCRRYMKEPEEK